MGYICSGGTKPLPLLRAVLSLSNIPQRLLEMGQFHAAGYEFGRVRVRALGC